MPKLLLQDQMDKRAKTLEAFVKMFQEKSRIFSGKILTMNKSAVLIHNPEKKLQSRQWLKKGAPGPMKAKVVTNHIKQMVLSFFNDKGTYGVHKSCVQGGHRKCRLYQQCPEEVPQSSSSEEASSQPW